MKDPKLNIFLSYSRKDTDIADSIDNDFKAVGITLQRDIRDLPYRSNIKEFMNRIGRMDFVLMILSGEYLRSEYCMYEVTELLNAHASDKRILPVLHENATTVFKPETRVAYYDYWKKEIAAAKKRLAQHPNTDHIDQVKRWTSIYEHLDVFFNQIRDLNVLSFSSLKEQGYKPMLDIIGTNESEIIREALLIKNLEDSEERDFQLEQFMDNYPGNKYGLFLKAYIAVEQKQYSKAQKHYEELILKFPQFAEAHYNLSNLLRGKFKDYDAAKAHLLIALEISPTYIEAHYNLALLLKNQFHDYEGAKAHYLTALDINTQNANTHNNLAILLGDQFRDYEGAKAHYIAALHIDPQDDKAHYNLAMLLTEQFKDYESAKVHYLTALELNPQFAEAHYNLANLLREQFKDDEGAKRHYRTALEINPKYVEVHYNLALLLKNQFHDYEEAKRHFLTALEINPQDASTHFNLAFLLDAHFSDVQAARKHYLIATSIDANFIVSELDNYFDIKR